jgi:zinc protease
MMKISNYLCGSAFALAVALSGCTTAERIAAPVAVQQQAVAAVWPQDASDLKADENVRFGVLPNGMRYAIMRNATPPGNASLRMRIDAGSLHEADDQLGLAHFIEHMALNETKNVPENEFIRILERHGLQFGPDTNAMTTFEQTVYLLDLPTANPETMDTALFLMREAMGEALFNAEAVDRERGVVLSEERTRAVPGYRATVDSLRFMFRDDLLADRLPIGSTEVLRTAPPERLADFYEKYYRPENATFIAIGDFDVEEMETKIRTRFSDWKAEGPAGPELPAPNLPAREIDTRVYSEAGLPSQITLSWLTPLDERPDSRQLREERMLQQLGLGVINRRLQRLSATTAPHMVQGVAARSDLAGRAEVTQMIAVSDPAKWRESLATLEQEQRRAVEHGFTQAEIEREITETRTRLTAAVAGAATRPSPQIAQGLVNAVNNDRVFMSPADNLALFEEAVSGLTPNRVHAATRALFTGSGPLVYMTSPIPIEGSEKTLLAAFTESRVQPVAANEVQQAKAWPYTEFGTPSTVAERKELAGIGATAVRFANGVRLTVKPTDFKADEVLVRVRLDGGRMALNPADAANLFAFTGGAFTGGGLGQLSAEELEEALAGTIYGANMGAGEDALTIGGRTRPQDFARQLQLLAAYVTDPGWRPTALDRIRSLAGTFHEQFETSPGGVFGRDSAQLLRSGDPRWATPSREQISGATIADLQRGFGGMLGAAPIDITIVGNVGVEEAIRQVAATFGALPPRPASKASSSDSVRFPAPDTVRRTHKGREDQALAFVAWPTSGFYSDQRRSRALNLLAAVMQLRLNEEIREKQGVAYSPNAGHSTSDTMADYGYLSTSVQLNPAGVDTFLADVQKIAADLRARPISEDELRRARRPFVERLQRNRASSNEWWLGQLGDIQHNPERLTGLQTDLRQYSEVTPAELQRLAQTYLVGDRAWRMIVVPEAQ